MEPPPKEGVTARKTPRSSHAQPAEDGDGLLFQGTPLFQPTSPISGDRTRKVQTEKAHVYPSWANLNREEALYSDCRSMMPHPCWQQSNMQGLSLANTRRFLAAAAPITGR